MLTLHLSVSGVGTHIDGSGWRCPLMVEVAQVQGYVTTLANQVVRCSFVSIVVEFGNPLLQRYRTLINASRLFMVAFTSLKFYFQVVSIQGFFILFRVYIIFPFVVYSFKCLVLGIAGGGLSLTPEDMFSTFETGSSAQPHCTVETLFWHLSSWGPQCQSKGSDLSTNRQVRRCLAI